MMEEISKVRIDGRKIGKFMEACREVFPEGIPKEFGKRKKVIKSEE